MSIMLYPQVWSIKLITRQGSYNFTAVKMLHMCHFVCYPSMSISIIAVCWKSVTMCLRMCWGHNDRSILQRHKHLHDFIACECVSLEINSPSSVGIEGALWSALDDTAIAADAYRQLLMSMGVNRTILMCMDTKIPLRSSWISCPEWARLACLYSQRKINFL